MVKDKKEGEKKRNVWVCRAVQFNGGGKRWGLLIVTAQIHMGMGGIVWE